MNAAERLFLEKGFERVSIEEITQGADVAKGTFYLQFSSKVDVLEALRTRFAQRLLDGVAAEVAKQRAEDEALLEHVIVMKKETAERSREFGEDSLPVLSARYDLAHALWNGHQYTGAAEFTQRLLDDCIRIVGDEHELTVSARQLQSAGRRYPERGSQHSETDSG